MKRILAIFITIAATCLSLSAQETKDKDWAKFYRYEQANDTIKIRPRAVFMGDSITDNWAKKSPDFFYSNNFVGRGISGQTTTQMLVRFRRDVLDLSPKYVVILADPSELCGLCCRALGLPPDVHPYRNRSHHPYSFLQDSLESLL